MITLEALTFRYESMMMEFNLHVARGEFMAVIGPSGAGKSTLLSLMAGFEKPLSGRMTLAGHDMAGVSPDQRPVNMIFQDHNSFAHLDIFTNVALGISPALVLDDAQRHSVSQALNRVGLAGYALRKPTEVSGGERQRIAIARALVRQKPILLLDEPFTALGPALRQEMLALLVSIQREQELTVLLVTHQPEDASNAASKVAFVDGGHITHVLETRALFASDAPPEIKAYLGG